jgi:hypothetical protein
MAESVIGLLKDEVIYRRGDRGEVSNRSSLPPWNGRTGSINDGCSSQSDISRRQSSSRPTMMGWKLQPRWMESHEQVSGIPGAVQSAVIDASSQMLRRMPVHMPVYSRSFLPVSITAPTTYMFGFLKLLPLDCADHDALHEVLLKEWKKAHDREHGDYDCGRLNAFREPRDTRSRYRQGIHDH